MGRVFLQNQIRGGESIGPEGFQEMTGNPTKVGSAEYSHDQNIAERLWKVSEATTGAYCLS